MPDMDYHIIINLYYATLIEGVPLARYHLLLVHNIHLGHHISISEPSNFIDFAIRFYFEVWNLQPRFPVPVGNILA